MKHLTIVLFVVALIATIAWFGILGNVRTKVAAGGNETATSALYVLIAASMSFLGETALGKYVPVQRLKRKLKLLSKRVKQEQQKVTSAQQHIISVENQGFWYDEHAAKKRATHKITSDHTRAEQPPCAK